MTFITCTTFVVAFGVLTQGTGYTIC